VKFSHAISSVSLICYYMDSLLTDHDSAMFDLDSEVTISFCAAGEVDDGRRHNPVLGHALAKTTRR